MRLSDTMSTAMSKQVTLELEASMVYLQLAILLEDQDLSGMSAWMRAQAEEEQVHAQKFINHCLDRGMAPQIGDIKAPKVSAKTPVELFEAALAHEEKVSEAIRELYRTAQNEGDVDAYPLLYWFIDEQLEEEATVGEIVGRLKMIGDDSSGLLNIDAELGSRQPDIDATQE